MTKTQKELINVIEKAENLDWSVNETKGDFTFSKYSPAGQDFNFQADSNGKAKILIENIKKAYDNFDVSEETYLWLDNSGHGANGAPYDMKDLYEDIEACEQMILDLYEELEKLL